MADIDPLEMQRRVEERRAGQPAQGRPSPGVDPLEIQRRVQSMRKTPPQISPASEPGFFGRAVQGVKGAITGEGQFSEDLPELQSQKFGFGESLRLAAAHMVSAEPAQIADIAEKTLPGVTRRTDDNGNIILKLPNDQEVFVNRPGFSGADAFKFISDIVQFFPAAKVAGFVKGLLPRAAATGLGLGVTSLAQDEASTALGSEQGRDFARAGITAFLGLGAELGAPLVSRIARSIPLGKRLATPDGKLTARGRDFVQSTGIDPDTMSPEAALNLDSIARRFSRRELNAMVRRAEQSFGDDAASLVAGAESRAGQIPLTTGQRTGDLAQLASEDAMRNVGRGGAAASTIRDFDERQLVAIRQRAGREQAALSGGSQRVDDALGAAGDVQQGVQTRAEGLSGRINRAFEQVRELPDARLNVSSLRQLNQGIRQSLKDRGAILDTDLTPRTVQTLKEFGKLSKAAKGPARVTRLTLRELEKQRRKINARINNAFEQNNKQDAGHLLAIKREHDRFIDDAFDNELFEGAPETLGVLKEARAARAEFGELFEARGKGDTAGKLIEKIVEGDRTNLEVANWMFGSAKIGQTPGRLGESVRLVQRLKEILPEPEFNSLREGALHRLVYGNTQRRTEDLSIRRIFDDLGEALEGNGREFMKELFSPQELNAFRSFRREIGRAVPQDRATQPSKTAAGISRLIQDAFAKAPVLIGIATGNPAIGAAATAGATITRGLTQRGAAEAAARGVGALPVPQISPLFRSLGAAGGAALSRDDRTTPR